MPTSRRIVPLALALAASPLAASPLAAQESPDSLAREASRRDSVRRDSVRRDSVRRAATLPGVTVTATREAAAILTIPLAVTKVGAAELRATSGYGIDEALRRVPGVLAQSRYGTSDVRLVIRGFGARGAGDRSNAGTSRGVRVLLDGIPETEPDGRTAFDNIDLAAAEAVEVIRSNASSAWGNAAGGVVNVLSVPAVDRALLELQPVAGAFGLRRVAVRTALPLGDVAGGGGVAYANFTSSSFGGWRAHSSARRALLATGVSGVVGTGTRVAVHVVGANNLMHIPGPLTPSQLAADPRQANATYAARDERRYNRTARIGATVDHAVRRGTSVGAMVFANPKYLQRSERGTYRDFTRYHVGGSLVARTTFESGGVRSRVTLGADQAWQDGAVLFYSLTPEGTRGSELRDNKGEGASNLGVFLQDEMRVGERLGLLLGARWDRLVYSYRSFLPDAPLASDRKAFSRVTPKLGASWLLGASRSVYANVGGGVEIPAGNETDPVPGQPPALVNPLLEPIRSTTYEVGVKSAGSDGADGTVAPVRVTWDLAVYHADVRNEIIPYNGGRYYQTAGSALRSGVELGIGATARAGAFAHVALTLSRNRYGTYVVDSTLLGAPGATADYGGNAVVGVPPTLAHVELGTTLPWRALRGVRVRGTLEQAARYWADDANTVRVPAYAIAHVALELREPIATAGGWGARGFVGVQNVGDRAYVGSAFLNPDRVGGEPAVYEPGMPRSVVVSVTVGRLRR